MNTPLAVGDLVEVIESFPWANEHTQVGARLIVATDPEPMDQDFPCLPGDSFLPQDPKGRWFGGDDVPVSHVKVIKRVQDVLPTAQAIAKAIQSALHDANEDTIRVTETGEQSEDTLYAVGETPDGVRVSFLVKVGAVEVSEI